MSQEEIKTTRAQTTYEIDACCPYCDYGQEITDEIVDGGYLMPSHFSAMNIQAEIECAKCHKTFIVTDVEY